MVLPTIPAVIDYFWCQVAGRLHPWVFRRDAKGRGIYLCPACNLRVTKEALKDHTDEV